MQVDECSEHFLFARTRYHVAVWDFQTLKKELYSGATAGKGAGEQRVVFPMMVTKIQGVAGTLMDAKCMHDAWKTSDTYAPLVLATEHGVTSMLLRAS